MVDSQVAVMLQPYLQAGERLTWTGRPPGGMRLSARDIYLVPFSLLWCGFAIFWEATVLRFAARPSGVSGIPLFMAVFGAAFVAVGLFMVFGRLVVDAWVRERTVYALSDRRALVLKRIPAETLTSTPLKEPTITRASDGSGTLNFGAVSAGFFSLFANPRAGWTVWIPSLGGEVVFTGIRDVMNAYHLARPRAPAP